jgi:hypothetical protein
MAPNLKPFQGTIDKINSMSRMEMARLWRFAPPGHPYFDSSLPYHEIFSKRFKELGGFSPEISKTIGWGD